MTILLLSAGSRRLPLVMLVILVGKKPFLTKCFYLLLVFRTCPQLAGAKLSIATAIALSLSEPFRSADVIS